MKLEIWMTGLLSLLGLLCHNFFVAPAVARCIQADISVQYNISGSTEPTKRTNDVEMSSDQTCQGNASITTGVQGNLGGNGRVRQTRVVRHRTSNKSTNRRYSERSGSMSAIQIQSNPAIDVYNPADNLNY